MFKITRRTRRRRNGSCVFLNLTLNTNVTFYELNTMFKSVKKKFKHLIQGIKVLRGVKMADPCEGILRNHRRNANESLGKK